MPDTRASKRLKSIHANDETASSSKAAVASASSDFYTHSPLPPHGDNIRLLKIHPPRRFSGIPLDIECSITMHHLGEDLDYEALSYVWGDLTQGTKSITIDGKPFLVTANLNAALLELRRFENRRGIWIDAICINQNDVEERSAQVRKMGKIFNYASKVIAWLGPASETSRLALDLIQTLKPHLRSLQATRAVILDPQYLQAFFGLYEFFYRPYFWRVWVIQEVALAKETILLLCGPDTLLWSDLVEVQENLASYHMTDIDFIAYNREELSFLRVTIESRGPRALMLPPKVLESRDLGSILLQHRFKESTDPKDQIYGLIGISEAANDAKFVLDYSRSVREVYMDLINYVVGTKKRLDLICAIPREEVNKHDLPSWCPDWSFEGLGSSMLNEESDIQYSASGDLDARAFISPTTGTLSCQGLILGPVTLISPPTRMTDLEDLQTAIRALFNWYELFIFHSLSHSNVGKERKGDDTEIDLPALQASFVRTMIRNMIPGPDLRNIPEEQDEFDFQRALLFSLAEMLNPPYIFKDPVSAIPPSQSGKLGGKMEGDVGIKEEEESKSKHDARPTAVHELDIKPEIDFGRSDSPPRPEQLRLHPVTATRLAKPLLEALYGRRFFIITGIGARPNPKKKNFMGRQRSMEMSIQRSGLGPEEVGEGDLVCLIYGCQMPVLLRKRGGSEKENGKEKEKENSNEREQNDAKGGYLFLGEVFVDGWMYGDDFGNFEEWDRGKECQFVIF